jgi:hypothetical protein
MRTIGSRGLCLIQESSAFLFFAVFPALAGFVASLEQKTVTGLKG